jgi:hypothetical protein
MSDFMGPSKHSSPVTTLSTYTSLLQGGEQGADFNLVGTSYTVVVCETRGTTRMIYWSGSSPTRCTLIRIIVTLSDMSDRLSLLSSRSMSFFMDGLEDAYGYAYHDDYCIYFNYIDDA